MFKNKLLVSIVMDQLKLFCINIKEKRSSPSTDQDDEISLDSQPCIVTQSVIGYILI